MQQRLGGYLSLQTCRGPCQMNQSALLAVRGIACIHLAGFCRQELAVPSTTLCWPPLTATTVHLQASWGIGHEREQEERACT
jgi:hypothetical protein